MGRPSNRERFERLRDLWPRLDMPVSLLAAEFGVGPSEISRRAKRMGLEPRWRLRWPVTGPRKDGRMQRI